MKFIKKIRRWYRWYIKGEYHCDKCPYCWEHQYYEGDCDCGCYIKGDIQEDCRLWPPFRAIAGKLALKKHQYYENHEFEGIGEWYASQQQTEAEFKRLMREFLGRYDLCYKDSNGTYRAIDKDYHINSEAWRVQHGYEEIAHPFEPPKPLLQQWKETIKLTWRAATEWIRPYICK